MLAFFFFYVGRVYHCLNQTRPSVKLNLHSASDGVCYNLQYMLRLICVNCYSKLVVSISPLKEYGS